MWSCFIKTPYTSNKIPKFFYLNRILEYFANVNIKIKNRFEMNIFKTGFISDVLLIRFVIYNECNIFFIIVNFI